MKQKDRTGRYVLAGDSKRTVRSVRATDDTWSFLSALAEEKGMTIADWLEDFVKHQSSEFDRKAYQDSILDGLSQKEDDLLSEIKEGKRTLTQKRLREIFSEIEVIVRSS